jgi:hypothetical protein
VNQVEGLSQDDRARLTSEQQRMQVQFAELQGRFTADQTQRIDRHNRQAAADYTTLAQQGGLKTTLQEEISVLRRQLAQTPSAPQRQEVLDQIQALQHGIENMAFCSSPLVFTETAFRHTNDVDDFVVEPLWIVTLYGCQLGRTPGQIRLKFPGTPDDVLLKVLPGHWRDDSLQAILPEQSGRVDGPAQLIVTTADGRQAPPLGVQFRATRVWSFVDPVAHPNVLFVDCGHNTTTDSCAAMAVKGPPQALYAAAVGKHFTFCCSSVSGTDRWAVSLRNGWTLMSLYPNSGDLSSSPDIPHVSFSFVADGYTTCNFFNRDGRITDYQEMPSSNSRLQGEIHIAWWVDHSCSGVQYAANIGIVDRKACRIGRTSEIASTGL